MQCHHCTIGAIKNGKEFLDKMIKRNTQHKEDVVNWARWAREHEERKKKKLEDVNVA
jgi:hypothetical protein